MLDGGGETNDDLLKGVGGDVIMGGKSREDRAGGQRVNVRAGGSDGGGNVGLGGTGVGVAGCGHDALAILVPRERVINGIEEGSGREEEWVDWGVQFNCAVLE